MGLDFKNFPGGRGQTKSATVRFFPGSAPAKDIERIQMRGMKIVRPEKTYEQALIECGMETLENRREKMCIKLINDMKGLIHKLNELLPPTVGHVRERDTRLNTNKFYNLNVEPDVLAIVFSVCIRKYNIAIDNL